jgi:dTDP-4-amino-4,6-dideoxygalactose transaminase
MKNTKIVTYQMPHEPWPPKPDDKELQDLADQRKKDISIKGKSGPIKELEEKFLAFLENERKYCISFNSGTSALLAAYFAIGIQEGDEVIGPALTFHAALSPLFILKGVPVLVDVDRNTRCIDPKLIEAAITPRTKAIAVVHQWGHPAHMDEILAIAKKHKLKVIEDCSHAHGSRYKRKMVGTFGDIAIFSLQAQKMLFAGEGGLFVTNNPEYHDRVTLLGHYRDRSREEIYDDFYKSFWVSGYGLKLRMSPYNAVTALHSLNKLSERIEGRKKCLTYFSDGIKDLPEVEIPYVASWADMGAWYGYKPLIKLNLIKGNSRDHYIQKLKEYGVEVDPPSAPVLNTLPLYYLAEDKMFSKAKLNPNKDKKFPVAEMHASTSLSLPTFTDWNTCRPIIDQYIEAFKQVSNDFV